LPGLRQAVDPGSSSSGVALGRGAVGGGDGHGIVPYVSRNEWVDTHGPPGDALIDRQANPCLSVLEGLQSVLSIAKVVLKIISVLIESALIQIYDIYTLYSGLALSSLRQ
jgi:hypothetical protein